MPTARSAGSTCTPTTAPAPSRSRSSSRWPIWLPDRPSGQLPCLGRWRNVRPVPRRTRGDVMAFEELKARQSVMWANGPYQNVTETLTDLQDLTVSRLAPGPGVQWLDLACGTGAIAERAASAGAEVVGIDLSPGLIETAQGRAKQLGLTIDYRVGDCENLEVGDGAFDVVSSTCGVMFAPDHEATARGLARVVKPGGRLGLANW